MRGVYRIITVFVNDHPFYTPLEDIIRAGYASLLAGESTECEGDLASHTISIRYKLVVLSSAYSRAYAVNSYGGVVGFFKQGTAHHAFRFQRGFVDLGSLWGAHSSGTDISEQGWVLGYVENNATSQVEGFVLREGVTSLGPVHVIGFTPEGDVLLSEKGDDFVELSLVNRLSKSSVLRFQTDSYIPCAYSRDVFTISSSNGHDPYQMLIHHRGTTTAMHVPDTTRLEAINAHAAVVGWYEDAGSTRALLWDNEITTLLRDDGYFSETVALSINDQGIIAGSCGRGEGLMRGSRGCLWINTNMIDVNTLIDDREKYVVREISCINNAMYACGTAYSAVDDTLHAILLVPLA